MKNGAAIKTSNYSLDIVPSTTDYVFRYNYGYDNVGNRLWMNSTVSGDHHYSYDNIYQVRAVDYPEGYFAQDTECYFDSAHNRQFVANDSATKSYNTNNLNQYTSIEGVSLAYDTNGNLTDDGTNSYTYDCENRLIKAVAGSVTTEYKYDSSGRRINKFADGSITHYVYDGDSVIYEYTVENDVIRTVRKFVYGLGIDQVVRMTVQRKDADIDSDEDVDLADLAEIWSIWLLDSQDVGFDSACDLNSDGFVDNSDSDIIAANIGAVSGISYYYHYDGLGSVAALTDSSGKNAEMYSYDIYGNFKIQNGSGEEISYSYLGNPYMFTARRYDPETKLYYYRARMYNPETGRFMQTDPSGYDDGMGWYAYVSNNPVNMVDSLGLFGVYGSGPWQNHKVDWGGVIDGIERFENGITGQVLSAYSEGALDGSAAWADGAIPFADPFENTYDVSDSTLKFSRAMGHVSRDAALAAFSSPANTFQYIKNPKLYEIGSIAMRNANYNKYALEGLSAVEKGRKLIAATGSAKNALKLTHLGKGVLLLPTGLTPAGGATLIGLFESEHLFK